MPVDLPLSANADLSIKDHLMMAVGALRLSDNGRCPTHGPHPAAEKSHVSLPPHLLIVTTGEAKPDITRLVAKSGTRRHCRPE
ncbi:hypothetical protein [Devosia sp. CAU 1758]